MAAAVANKAFPLPQKIKRPAPPTLQTTANGVKPPNPSPSPSSASKRLPGQKQSPFQPSANGAPPAGSMARPNRPRKENGRPDPSQRLHRLSTRSGALDGSGGRPSKIFPEPHVVGESHILRKFPPKDHPPSLIIHLHPTYFRFDQQEGSFSYHSDMRFIIEHLQKKTIPHEMLEELRREGVRFYDGWLIVRVVDHKGVAETPGSSSANSSDDKVPYSIHNYTPYVTPSPYVPYQGEDKPNQPNTKSATQSPNLSKEKRESKSETEIAGTSEGVAAKASPKKEPKVYHIALRPTTLSRHQDIVIDSMTPDPKSLNRRLSHVASSSRTPGSATLPAPPTPLGGVPQTPSGERAPPAKKIKMKIEARDLLDYEARIINSTAPPLFLDPVEDFEAAQQVIDSLRDPLHEQLPPSPKGRKRTVAELAADEAIARDQERFMTIMDDRLAAVDAVGNGAATAVDGQSGNVIFNPRFERFNALETIKQRAEERRVQEHEEQMNAEKQKRERQEQEMKRLQAQRMHQEMVNKRHSIEQRNAAANAAQAANAAHHASATAAQQAIANANQNLHAMPQQAQMLRTSQAQTSSPIIRTQTPHSNSSPIAGNLSQAAHSIPMNPSVSNQGSPPRPGSALQHGHPGMSMARSTSQQGASHHGTPQMAQRTPALSQATPNMRTATPVSRMQNASPHSSNMAPTPQMTSAPMMVPQTNGATLNPQNPAHKAFMMQQLRLQQHQQQQNAMAHQPNGPNGHPVTQQQLAMLQARQAAQQQAQLQAQQQQHQSGQQEEYRHALARMHAQQMQQNQAQQTPQQQTHAIHAQAQAQAHAQAQAQAHAQQQGSPQHHMATPQHHPAQMHSTPNAAHHPVMPPNQQQQNPQVNAATQQRMRALFQQRFTQLLNSPEITARYGGAIPQPVHNALRAQAQRETQGIMQRQNQQIAATRQMQAQAQAQRQSMTPQQQFQMQQILQHQQQQQQQQQNGMMMPGGQGGHIQGMPGQGMMPK